MGSFAPDGHRSPSRCARLEPVPTSRAGTRGNEPGPERVLTALLPARRTVLFMAFDVLPTAGHLAAMEGLSRRCGRHVHPGRLPRAASAGASRTGRPAQGHARGFRGHRRGRLWLPRRDPSPPSCCSGSSMACPRVPPAGHSAVGGPYPKQRGGRPSATSGWPASRHGRDPALGSWLTVEWGIEWMFVASALLGMASVALTFPSRRPARPDRSTGHSTMGSSTPRPGRPPSSSCRWPSPSAST